MIIFGRSEVSTAEPVTGTSVIRAALRAKNKKVNLAMMARDLGMQTSTLEDFAENRVKTLAPDVLQKILGFIWTNGTRLDVEHNLLVAGNEKPAISMGTPSAPWPKGPSFEIGASRMLTTPLPPGPQKPFKGSRPGWA